MCSVLLTTGAAFACLTIGAVIGLGLGALAAAAGKPDPYRGE